MYVSSKGPADTCQHVPEDCRGAVAGRLDPPLHIGLCCCCCMACWRPGPTTPLTPPKPLPLLFTPCPSTPPSTPASSPTTSPPTAAARGSLASKPLFGAVEGRLLPLLAAAAATAAATVLAADTPHRELLEKLPTCLSPSLLLISLLSTAALTSAAALVVAVARALVAEPSCFALLLLLLPWLLFGLLLLVVRGMDVLGRRPAPLLQGKLGPVLAPAVVSLPAKHLQALQDHYTHDSHAIAK